MPKIDLTGMKAAKGSTGEIKAMKGGALIWQKPGVIAPFGFVTRRTAVGSALSRTFAGIELGTPSAGRDVFVGIPLAGTSDAQVSAVTIAGIPATLVAKNGTEGGVWNVFTSLWHARVPTGVVGDIVVTHMNNAAHATILVFAGEDVTVSAVGTAGAGVGSPTITVNLVGVASGHRLYAFGAAFVRL